MNQYGKEKREERRRGPDGLTKSIRWVSVGGWVLLLMALIFIDLAKPEYVSIHDVRSGVADSMRTSWNMGLAKVIFFLMIGGFVFGTYGFLVNMKRNRRKTDKYRLNLLALAIISVFGAVYYLLYF